ncbi:hypothetical protein KIW84_024033 [Lathyrus oleraceus]|uniref:DEAD-box RNA helicase Q domain-containing protein n=1 Tax=Pisum sativum TaxID=3888 RepID=A0A9D4YEJ9_PEA|nr:hypothetical protein KIW84_024033 [Pisum sativum]
MRDNGARRVEFAIEVEKGQKVSDYKPMLELVLLLVRSYIPPLVVTKSQEDICFVGEVLNLMLATLDGLRGYSKSTIPDCASQWAPIFKSQSSTAECLLEPRNVIQLREIAGPLGAEVNGESGKKGYVGIHGSGFRDFLLKPELLRAIVDSGFEHPSEIQHECILHGIFTGSSAAVKTYFEAPERVAALILIAPAIFAPLTSPKVVKENQPRQDNEVKEDNGFIRKNPIVKLYMSLSKIIKNVVMTITKMMKPMIDILNSLYRKLLSTILLSSPAIMLVRMAIDKFGTAAVRNVRYDPKQVSEHVLSGYTQPLRVKDWDRALVEFTAATLLDEESNIPVCCTQNTQPAITGQFKPSNASNIPLPNLSNKSKKQNAGIIYKSLALSDSDRLIWRIDSDGQRKNHIIGFNFDGNSMSHNVLKSHIHHQFYEWLHPTFKPSDDSKNIPDKFCTVASSHFGFYADQFWSGSQPTIPKLVHRWLSPCVLAYWYMYGGHRNFAHQPASESRLPLKQYG